MKNIKTISATVLLLLFSLSACSGNNTGSDSLSSPDTGSVSGAPNTPLSPSSPIVSTPITTPPSASAKAIADLEANGSIPKLDRSESLAGPDLDGNGVRDDVDAWIKSKLTDPKQIAAVVQSAKVMQKAILVDVVNKVAVKLVFQSMMSSVNCLSSRFPHDGSNLSSSAIGQKIESLMTNTKPRLKAYLAFSKALDGSVASLPTGDTCD